MVTVVNGYHGNHVDILVAVVTMAAMKMLWFLWQPCEYFRSYDSHEILVAACYGNHGDTGLPLVESWKCIPKLQTRLQCGFFFALLKPHNLFLHFCSHRTPCRKSVLWVFGWGENHESPKITSLLELGVKVRIIFGDSYLFSILILISIKYTKAQSSDSGKL